MAVIQLQEEMCALSHLNLGQKKWNNEAEACHENCNEELFLDFFLKIILLQEEV